MNMPVYCEYNPHYAIHQPVNFLSNIVFFIVATYFCLHWKNLRWITKSLIIVLIIMGFGSAWFHGWPSTTSIYSDILPTFLFFMLYFAWVLYVGYQWRLWQALLGICLYLLLTVAIMTQVPTHFLDGATGYLFLLLIFVLLAAGLISKAPRISRYLFMAAAVFAISGFFRSIDLRVCQDFPIGTHFIWHLLNPLMLGLLIRSTEIDR